MAREIFGDDPSFVPLTEPEFEKLVDRVVRKHQRYQTSPGRRRLVGEVVTAWERDRTATVGSIIDSHPLIGALAGMAGY